MDIQEGTEADHETSKFLKESVADKLTDMIDKNSQGSPTLSDIDISCLTPKQKPSKKLRRPPNAFILFAKEQRCNLDLPALKEKKCHTNSVLGNMWKDLPDSEKAKYFNEARRLLSLHKKSEPISFSKNIKKERKVRFKLPAKLVEKSYKKKKEYLPKTGTNLRMNKPGDIKKLVIESDTSKPGVVKTENTGTSHPSSEPHIDENPNCCSQHQCCITKSQSHYRAPSSEYHHSKCSCGQSKLHPDYRSDYKQHTTPDLGLSRSCFATGFYPSMFPSYPFNAPFWTYQQAMAHHVLPPLPPTPFPPYLPNSYSSPYFYNNAYNSSAYFNSFSSLYSGRVSGPSSAESNPNCSATAVGAPITKQESAEVTKSTEDFVDELSVDSEKDSPRSGHQEKTG